MTRAAWLAVAVTSLVAACTSQAGVKEAADAAPGVGEAGAAPPAAKDGGNTAPDPLLAPARCTSGSMRDPNESEGPEMNPGHACITCHSAVLATGDDAPIFAFAGTVFPSGHEPDNCAAPASKGAVVTVTDAAGEAFTATVNDVGNFFVEDSVMKFPITASVELGGRKRRMTSPQMSGDCNSCHSQEGEDGAPGRITLP